MSTLASADGKAVGLAVQKVVEPDADQGVHPEPLKPDGVVDVEAADNQVGAVTDLERYPPPTEEELTTLRKVSDSIPWVAWTLCVVELAERASYYGATTVFNNFIEYPLPDDGPGTGAINRDNPNDTSGALGLGVQTASALTLLFTFLAYVVPIFGAWVADTKLGRYKTIMIGVIIGAVAHVIMIGAAAPSLLKSGRAIAPFLVSFFVLAIGAGTFKPNVAPTVIDQYRHQRVYTKVLKSGEKVLVDPETTISRIMLIFYAAINVGAFFAIATTYAEKYVGYWLAFLLPGIVYILLPALLVAVSPKIVKRPPQGSELTRFVKITWTALVQNRFIPWTGSFWAKANPAYLAEKGIVVKTPWTEKHVRDVARAWDACQIFLYIPVYSINDGGVGAVSSNQAGSMTTNGAPNDLLGNFNPLVIIVFAPFMSHLVYPALARRKIHVGPISRMTIGFVLAIISGIIGALVQWRVYETSPCGYQASTCDEVSPISVWWQIPNISLGAISEVFVNVTSYEMAYARAPPNLKATVYAICLFMSALSAALSEILIPAIDDPTLIWAWAAPAIALFVQTIIFWVRHNHVNNDEYMTYSDDEEEAGELINEKSSEEGEGR